MLQAKRAAQPATGDAELAELKNLICVAQATPTPTPTTLTLTLTLTLNLALTPTLTLTLALTLPLPLPLPLPPTSSACFQLAGLQQRALLYARELLTAPACARATSSVWTLVRVRVRARVRARVRVSNQLGVDPG